MPGKIATPRPDTTLAITRMIFEGFFDQYPNLKILASPRMRAARCLPYLAGRFEKGNEVEIAQRRKIKRRPIDYLRHIYYDCITYSPPSLEFLVSVAGADRVMFGTDWPHQVYDIRGAFAGTAPLPKDQCDAIRGNNALRVFGFCRLGGGARTWCARYTGTFVLAMAHAHEPDPYPFDR
jgi:aminocarboxymuconate-semialdehyde decarboxylase